MRDAETIQEKQQRIAALVCEVRGVTVDELRNQKWTKELTKVRLICVRLMQSLTSMSVEQIAMYFGRETHWVYKMAAADISRQLDAHIDWIADQLRENSEPQGPLVHATVIDQITLENK